MKTENLSTLKIHKLTKAQYEREFENGNLDENALYLTPDEEIYVTDDQLNDKADEILEEAKGYVNDIVNGQIGSTHDHDDRYYTEAEIDSMLSNMPDLEHNHDIEDVLGLQDAFDGKADLNHTHVNDDIKLYDILTSGYSPLSVVNAPTNCILEVRLSSDTITDFSNLTIVCAGNGLETRSQAPQDGVTHIIGMYKEFTITLESEHDISDVLITCSEPINLEKVIKENILHIDEELWDNTDSGDIDGVINAGSVLIDSTLSVSGAAADAKITGDGINRLNELVGNTSVADQISDAIVEKVFIQHTEPIAAPDGSIWIDLVESGQPNESAKASANVYVVDAGTTDMTTIDFSQFKIGDVILVTSS